MTEKWTENATGIVILLIVISNFCNVVTEQLVLESVYGLSLTILFVLIGYSLRKTTITQKYLNRLFSKLMAPYFITCTSVIVMDVVNSYVINKDSSFSTITNIIATDLRKSFMASASRTDLGQLDTGTSIGLVWIFPATIAAILLVQLVVNYVSNISCCWIVVAVIAIVGFISARFIWLPFSIQSGMMATFFVWVGYEIQHYKILGKVSWQHYVISLIVLLLGSYLGYCNIKIEICEIDDLCLSPIVAISGFLLIYWISKKIPGKVLSFVGKNASIVFCVHWFALETLDVYFNKFFEIIGVHQGSLRIGLTILTHIVLSVLVVLIIGKVSVCDKSALKGKNDVKLEKRDKSIDITKGILIILMIIGHFGKLDKGLNHIIYSCHMVAFVLLSGYFYNKRRSFGSSLIKMLKSFLVPYAIFVCCKLILSVDLWNLEYIIDILKQYAIGMSFSNKIFVNISSVGPVYFILLLFSVRLIYMAIDKVSRNERQCWSLVVATSVFGMLLGVYGYWLPWSIDISCYAVVFYKIGLCLKEQKILEKIKDNDMLYFIVAPIWAYMIYAGGMEIAVRNYGQYGLAVIGATAGTLLIYKLSNYIKEKMKVMSLALIKIGECTIYVLIVHSLLGDMIWRFFVQYFNSAGTLLVVSQVLTQLLIAVIIKLAKDFGMKFLTARF